MPEAPDLEVIKDYLNEHVQGQTVEAARVLRPTVLRSLAGEFAADVSGRTLGEFQRRGKFLLTRLSGGTMAGYQPYAHGRYPVLP